LAKDVLIDFLKVGIVKPNPTVIDCDLSFSNDEDDTSGTEDCVLLLSCIVTSEILNNLLNQL